MRIQKQDLFISPAMVEE